MKGHPDDLEDFLSHADDMRRLARALVHDPNAADDLTQDAWVEMLEGRAPPAAARDRTRWLGGLLRNLKRERARGEGRRTRRDRTAARAEGTAGELDVVERLETFRILAAEVAELEEPYRSSVWQRFFEGRNAEEIASESGVTAAAVRSRWMRALARLRERLDERYGGDRREWMSALIAVARPDDRSRNAPMRRVHLGAAAALLGVVATWLTLSGPSEHTTAPAAATSFAGEVAEASGGPEPELARALDTDARESLGNDLVSEVAGSTNSVVGSGPLRLHLVDLWSGTGIGDCRVRARTPDGPREWVSDSDGWLRTEALVFGRFGLEILDDRDGPRNPLPGEAREFRRSRPYAHRDGDEHEWIVPIGPTYALDLDLPPGVEAHDLRARLDSGLERTDIVRTAAFASVRTRASDPVDSKRAWVRFGAEARALAVGRQWTLRLESEDGRFGGEACVASTLSARVEVVAVHVESRSALTVSVVGARGRALGPNVESIVESIVEASRSDGTPIFIELTDGGAWRAGALVPGPVRITARALGFPSAERTVEVSGPSTHAVIPFAAVEPGGPVTGIVRAPRTSGRVEVILRDAWGVEKRTSTRVPEDASNDRAFRFDDVPTGAYELRAEAPHRLEFEPRSVRVEAPANNVFVHATEVLGGPPLVVKAHDARTGVRLEHFDVSIELADGSSIRRSTSIGSVTLPGLTSTMCCTWSIAAPGWVCAHGEGSDLRSEPDRSSLDVMLDRGTYLTVHVVEDATGAPVAGVGVIVDGFACGGTNERGDLELILDSCPTRLGVRSSGWRIAAGDVDAVTGAWTSHDADRLELRLERTHSDARD